MFPDTGTIASPLNSGSFYMVVQIFIVLSAPLFGACFSKPQPLPFRCFHLCSLVKQTLLEVHNPCGSYPVSLKNNSSRSGSRGFPNRLIRDQEIFLHWSGDLSPLVQVICWKLFLSRGSRHIPSKIPFSSSGSENLKQPLHRFTLRLCKQLFQLHFLVTHQLHINSSSANTAGHQVNHGFDVQIFERRRHHIDWALHNVQIGVGYLLR